MDQNFSLMAQSRANYYTAGSPVQFVRVELLKGDTTGEVAVCLTFKNVGTEPLTGLVVHFKCKDAAGQVLCEDDFYYEQLNAQPGAVFGSDDAVYVSDTPVSSVEVEQDRAFLNGRGVDLRGLGAIGPEDLAARGVEPSRISEALEQKPYSHVKGLANAMQHIEVWHEGRAAGVFLDLAVMEAIEHADGLIDMVRVIEGVEVAVVMKEKEQDICRVSMRSKGRDVTKAALKFGGGGHIRAAGCAIRCPFAEAKAALMAAVDDVLEADS